MSMNPQEKDLRAPNGLFRLMKKKKPHENQWFLFVVMVFRANVTDKSI